MTWSDAARKASAAARRAKAKGGKTWANKGYKGTVDDQLRAMTPEQRAKVHQQHPWMAPAAPGSNPLHPAPYQQPKTHSAAYKRYMAAKARRGK